MRYLLTAFMLSVLSTVAVAQEESGAKKETASTVETPSEEAVAKESAAEESTSDSPEAAKAAEDLAVVPAPSAPSESP